jgi:processive 1,2-diacylglycerol beta-glucosyltransferase
MAAGTLAEEGSIDVPVVAVVTDYVVHRAWMHRGVTRYFVAHEHLIERLGAFGFAGRAIVSGIPVRCGFRLREGVRSKRRILVMGGCFGLVALAPILRAAGRMDEPTTLHIIAGSEAKKRKAQQMAKEYPYPIIIEGHSHMVDEAMRQASLLITKAGGVSVAESLAIGVPLILFGSLAGQEEANTEFLVSYGVALTANDEDGLYQNIRAILSDENGVRSSMLAKQAKLARPDAANDIARELGKRINSR